MIHSRGRSVAALLGVTATLSVIAPSHANFLINGSFEHPGFNGAIQYLPPGSQAMTGWTTGLGGGFWEHASFGVGPTHGSYVFELDGPGDPDSRGSLTTQFPTTIGQSYRFTFDQGIQLVIPGQEIIFPGALGFVSTLRVTIDGVSTDFSSSAAILSTNGTSVPFQWTSQSMVFTATSPLTTLHLESRDFGIPGGLFHPGLDNLVIDIPGPASLACGALAAAILLRRRRMD